MKTETVQKVCALILTNNGNGVATIGLYEKFSAQAANYVIHELLMRKRITLNGPVGTISSPYSYGYKACLKHKKFSINVIRPY